jgi:predicted nucleotidyltransferase component of viral defense system
MIQGAYKKQVALLLKVLPEVAKEACFALYGGTAINLFIRDMPRLSVDIDLIYIPIEDRTTSLTNISAALGRIGSNIKTVIRDSRVAHREDAGKLQISADGADIKLEVNIVARGTLAVPQKMTLCAKAQEEFDAFCAIQVVPFGQLYGGKIRAALDRQHPRDLFDVKGLLETEGFSEEVRRGFVYSLVCSDRPMNELISPNSQDQRSVLENQFAGMATEAFSYEEFEKTRKELVNVINRSLTAADRRFLLSVKGLTPDWSIYDFEQFSAVAWKLQNLQKLKATNPDKYRAQYELLRQKLDLVLK